MSIVAIARRPRLRSAVRVTEASPDLLSALPPGSTAEIVGICVGADPATARRLIDLGFVPGAEVSTVRRAPMADPVIFRVAGCELALRRVQAQCIRVSGIRVGIRASA